MFSSLLLAVSGGIILAQAMILLLLTRVQEAKESILVGEE